jgi:hypothetical protein
MKKTLLALLTVTLLAAAPAAAESSSNGPIDDWNKLRRKLNRMIDVVDREEDVPKNAWLPFKEDRKSLQKDIGQLVDDAVEILSVSDLTEIKKEINAAQENIREYQRQVSELETKSLMAPEDVSQWKFWKKDLDDYAEQIADYREKIEENRTRIQRLKARLYRKLQETGLNLDPAQIDTLVLSVTGDDDLELISVFGNIKAITEKLAQMTRESGENIETARKYYGMYAVLLRILIRLQQAYIDRVDDQYLPALAEVIENNQALMDKTRRLLAEADPEHKTMFRSNLDAQNLTDETARLYRRFLVRSQRRVAASLDQTLKEYQVAENTYQTVSTAYSLAAMIRDSEQMFTALAGLQVPDLLTFENQDMRREFEKLTSRLKED